LKCFVSPPQASSFLFKSSGRTPTLGGNHSCSVIGRAGSVFHFFLLRLICSKLTSPFPGCASFDFLCLVFMRGFLRRERRLFSSILSECFFFGFCDSLGGCPPPLLIILLTISLNLFFTISKVRQLRFRIVDAISTSRSGNLLSIWLKFWLQILFP